MVTKTEAISKFLIAKTHEDLAALYCYDMEVQITVSKGNGERIDGDYKGKQWHGYTDGVQTWKPIRIPLNANTTPEYTDSEMTWDLAAHAEGIGMTGWDWKNRLSRWVAYDFDSITGHSDKHAKKLSDDELNKIRTALSDIPSVSIRKSTGGRGLHVYIFLEPIETNNHNEHAAVARAILSHLSGVAGFDFNARVDVCGSNMWVFHRKMADTNGEGLRLLKPHTQLGVVPGNWRDYTPVVSGRRTKNLPRFIEDQTNIQQGIEDTFNELTGQRLRVTLDNEHKSLMKWLEERYPNAVWWDAEHSMMVTHTALLKEAHTALNMRGKFETLAVGEERGYDINCFCFALSKGGWSIRRYTLGVAEHPSWKQDGQGWTSTILNREPTLEQAAGLYGGVENPSGGFWFSTAEEARAAALLLGANLDLPNWMLGKKTILKIHKTGKLIAVIEKDNNDQPVQGWLCENKKMTRMFSIKNPSTVDGEAVRLDDQLRHITSEDGNDLGWALKSDNEWHNESYQHIKDYLKSMGHKDPSQVLGPSIVQCWKLVNQPFREEYPRDRQWNRYAAKLRFQPSLNRDNLNYPTWLRILNHCGQGLNDAVSSNEWCKSNGIQTGADWLKCWIASLFQEPMEPLPYIFFYGPQDSGKSIFHESLSLLVTRGVCRADNALVSQSGFNGELEGCVLAVVEETDLKRNLGAYNKIKDWVTSRMLSIHKKMKQPILIPNSIHFVQTSNSHLSCPVFPGDTRITMIFVDAIDKKDMIPKKDIIPLLEAEAADFLAEILSLELPKSFDRLNVPCLSTEDKYMAEYANKSPLEMFCEEKCFHVLGVKTKFSDFYEKFLEYIDPNLVATWSKIRVGKELPPRYVKARISGTGDHYIGNLSLTEVTEIPTTKYISKDGRLLLVPIESKVVALEESNVCN